MTSILDVSFALLFFFKNAKLCLNCTEMQIFFLISKKKNRRNDFEIVQTRPFWTSFSMYSTVYTDTHFGRLFVTGVGPPFLFPS